MEFAKQSMMNPGSQKFPPVSASISSASLNRISWSALLIYWRKKRRFFSVSAFIRRLVPAASARRSPAKRLRLPNNAGRTSLCIWKSGRGISGLWLVMKGQVLSLPKKSSWRLSWDLGFSITWKPTGRMNPSGILPLNHRSDESSAPANRFISTFTWFPLRK